MLHQYCRYLQRRFWGILFLCSLSFCLWLNHLLLIGEVGHAQTSDAGQLVQQGIQSYQLGRLRKAIDDWEEALKLYQGTQNRANEAVVLENLARAYQQVGQMNQSLAYWDRVIAYYQQVKDMQQVGRMLIEQSQVYNSLGQPKKAIALLCGKFQEELEEESTKIEPESTCLPESALQIAYTQKDQMAEAAALGSLGEAYRLVGSYNRAIKYLHKAEKIAPQSADFLVLNSLGNAYVNRAQRWELRAESAKQSGVPKADKFKEQSQSDYGEAVTKFQNSFQKAGEQGNQIAQIRALMNLIQLYYRSPDKQIKFEQSLEKALVLLDKLPDSATKVYLTLDLANLPVITERVSSPLTQCPQQRQIPDAQAIALLNNAVKITDNLQDSRSQSFANGALAHFYECRREYETALKLTQKALWQADQNLGAKDSLYLWQWQAGRILRSQNNKILAVTAYQQAYSTLEEIRSNILEADKDLQFDFRDIVEPLYRELAQLRLELASLAPETNKGQLTTAIETIESLKLAELQNYFGNDCVIAAINSSRNVEELLQEDTAVFSSIVFSDRTAILLSLPNGSQRLKWIDEERQLLQDKIKEFRESLINGIEELSDEQIKKNSQSLYDKILRQFEPDIAKVKTLVFIQDSFLRSIPMAALYDGKQYLIEKYAIATTPSLRLTAPKNLNRQRSRALILGVTKKAKVDEKEYPALLTVNSEVEVIQKQFSGSKLFLDQDFNRNNLEKELEKNVYPIIHISTHAQFGTIAEDTFLVAGDNNKLTIKELETTLRRVNRSPNSVELLTLTACQTAVGDDRITLGLAGIALQVGVKSALASLWSVNDESTFKLISAFYENFRNSGVSKAEALRQAQIKLINAKKIPDINDQYDNPAFWAPFILSGNWL